MGLGSVGRIFIYLALVVSSCSMQDLKFPVVGVVQSLSCVQFFVIPMGCSPRGSSVFRILRGRILEWVAISSSRGSS